MKKTLAIVNALSRISMFICFVFATVSGAASLFFDWVQPPHTTVLWILTAAFSWHVMKIADKNEKQT